MKWLPLLLLLPLLLPHGKSGGGPYNMIKMSVEYAKTTQNAKNRFLVFFSRSTKTEKTKRKQAEAENNELKTNTELHPVVFAYLAVEDAPGGWSPPSAGAVNSAGASPHL
jgi:hypothetical protein